MGAVTFSSAVSACVRQEDVRVSSTRGSRMASCGRGRASYGGESERRWRHWFPVDRRRPPSRTHPPRRPTRRRREHPHPRRSVALTAALTLSRAPPPSVTIPTTPPANTPLQVSLRATCVSSRDVTMLTHRSRGLCGGPPGRSSWRWSARRFRGLIRRWRPLLTRSGGSFQRE